MSWLIGPLIILFRRVTGTQQRSVASVPVTMSVDGLVHELCAVFVHAAVGSRRGEIDDRVVQGLHLNLKLFQAVKGNATPIGSQFNQGFGVGKTAHVHFDGKFLELAPCFDYVAHGRQTSHQGTVVQNGTGNHPDSHQQERQPIEQRVLKLVPLQ